MLKPSFVIQINQLSGLKKKLRLQLMLIQNITLIFGTHSKKFAEILN